MKPSDRGSRGDTKALKCAPLAFCPVAGEVVLMHHRGLSDAHGRPRAQEDAAEAHGAKQVAATTRPGKVPMKPSESRLKRGYQSSQVRASRVLSGGWRGRADTPSRL